MRRAIPVILFAILLGGCAAYKELTPEPPLSPAERGYIELKDDAENFTLEKDGKYFIRFPRPDRDQFSLVLNLSAKPSLQYYLTNTFDDGEGVIERIQDQTPESDTVSAFAVSASAQEYFWVIENVRNDVELRMTYRYVPQWRFTFEHKYAEYKRILSDNTVERTTYNSMDRNFDFSSFPFADQFSQLDVRTNKVRAMKNELLKLESVFPPNIANTADTSYANYVELRTKTTDELQFQENYATVLRVFRKEQESHGNTAKFLEAAPEFAAFVSQRDKFRRPILDKATDVFTARLREAPAFYDGQLRAKNDAKPIVFTPPLENATKLYAACGAQLPADMSAMTAFVGRYNEEASAMQTVNGKFREIDRAFAANPPWLSEELYADLLGKITDIKGKLPESRTQTIDKYGRYACATQLDADIRSGSSRANSSESLFLSAQEFVQQLNANSWATAEGTLRAMHFNGAYAGVPAVNDEKGKFVRAFENELFARVKQLSFQRVDAFVKANEAAIDNVAALYRDSAFVPVYQIGFSSAGDAEAQRRRQEVQNYIDKLKYNDFPAASIRAIYRDFIANINDRGVDRTRAIVEHGKNYKGDDKQLRSMVNECDPMVAKWIIKPKEYRKQFALPVSTNPRGTNEYVFRVLLKIPSEAQFPVFEINLKLPKEVAEKAGTQSWYESIKINKTPIKNEGRFTITSPTGANNYESQVSPVQMDKEGNNVLEVRFKYPGYKVFEVSTMAQVPIIRKN